MENVHEIKYQTYINKENRSMKKIIFTIKRFYNYRKCR